MSPDEAGLPLDLDQTLEAVGAALNSVELRVAALEKELTEGLQVTAGALGQMASRLGDLEDAGGETRGSGDEPPDLAEWVAWLSDTYKLSSVLQPGGNQPAWSEVPAMRHELSALLVAAHRAFGPRASAWDPASWHDQLDRSLARFELHRKRFVSLRDF